MPGLIRNRTVRGVRAAGWRVLGNLPAERQPASQANPWKPLRTNGLRVEAGLRLLGSGSGGIRIYFEAPVQLNNASMHLYRDLHIGMYSFMRMGTARYVDSIGRYTSIGPGVIVGEAEHPTQWLTMSPTVFDKRRWFFYAPDKEHVASRVVTRDDTNTDPATRRNATIGHDVWIGANAVIRRGVHIGDGAIVAAGAFVNHDVAPYSIVGGLPAKVIGQRFDDETIEQLMALKWWQFDINDFDGIDVTNIHSAVDAIAEREQSGSLQRTPQRFNSVKITNRGFSGFRPAQ